MIQTIVEREHADRAGRLRLAFRKHETLAEFLHQNFRAAEKSFRGVSIHDHGWNQCSNKRKAYFRRRAAWLLTFNPSFNGHRVDPLKERL